MPLAYRSPGVYREEVFLVPEASLPSGVPVFIGCAEPADTGSAGNASVVGDPISLHHQADFGVHLKAPPDSYLPAVVTSFFDNGGVRCFVVPVDTNAPRASAFNEALQRSIGLDDVDLLAMPDVMTLRHDDGSLDRATVMRLQANMLAHCSRHRRLAILAALPGSADDSVIQQARAIASNQAEPLNAALYYPWVRTSEGQLVPPCGHVAGIIARSDQRVGVFKAPANEELLGVVDVESVVDSRMQERLNVEGVNCIRSFASRGIRLWGARTLSRDADYRYVNNRRIVILLQRAIERRMAAHAFEPNDPNLWVRVQRELEAYLESLWQAGGLKGDVAEDAFYVQCDAETNPPDSRELGQLAAEVGLAMNAPAEFVVIRVTRLAGSLETDDAE